MLVWDLVAELIKPLLQWCKGLIVSRDEKEMLVRALPSGEIVVLSTDQRGSFVRPGSSENDRYYFDERDRAVQQKGMETLGKLVARSWVRHEGGVLHRLTAIGFKRARKFQKTLKRK